MYLLGFIFTHGQDSKKEKKNNVFNCITVESVIPENIDFVYLNDLKVMVQAMIKFDYICVV